MRGTGWETKEEIKVEMKVGARGGIKVRIQGETKEKIKGETKVGVRGDRGKGVLHRAKGYILEPWLASF